MDIKQTTRLLGLSKLILFSGLASSVMAADGFITQPGRSVTPTVAPELVIESEPKPEVVTREAKPEVLTQGSRAGLSWVKRETRAPAILNRTERSSRESIPTTGHSDGWEAEYIRIDLPRPSPGGAIASGTSPVGSDATRLASEGNVPGESLAMPFAPQALPEPPSRQANNLVSRVTGDAHQAERFQLASKVSRMITGEADDKGLKMIEPARNIAGWDWLGRQLSTHLDRSDQLLQRGVIQSAREEANFALLSLARHLDHVSNQFVCEPGMHAATTALRESGDFISFLQSTDGDLVKQIVLSHETPILKQTELRSVSPVTIAEHYRQYAEQQIVAASQEHPWFGDILYALGRTCQAEADGKSGLESDFLRGQSVVYYRAALAIQPTHALAANQLGFILLQLDCPLEAQRHLIASVDVGLTAPALQNLAEASRRLRDQPMEHWALQTLAAIQSRQTSTPTLPTVELLDNASFASISPMAAGPKATSESTSQTAQAPSVLR